MIEFCAKFVDVERREGLFRRELGGVPYWHLIRAWFFEDLVLPHFMKIAAMHPDERIERPCPPTPAERVLHKVGSAVGRLRDATVCNPDVALRARRILFAMMPRMVAMGDGRIGNVWLDFVTPFLKSSYALWEHSRLCGYALQPFSRKVLHLPRAERWRSAVLAPSGRFAAAAPRRRAEAETLADLFEREYGFPFESGRVWWMIDEMLRFREIYAPLFKRWFRRLGVRVLVTTIQAGRENAVMTEVAHDLGIPVAEMQHGTVYAENMVYHLGEREKTFSPDYFLAWGDHWGECLSNYANERFVSVGYPFLDHFVHVCPRRPRQKGNPLRVLFVSQPTVGAEMSRMALELARRISPDRCRVVYKLHPNETNTWRTLYPGLVDSPVEVVGNCDRNIYQCLCDADVTVGTNSTALVEGFTWGVPALVLRFFPAGEIMGEYCRAGVAEFVDSEEALYAKVRAMADDEATADVFRFDATRFWVPNAAENVARFLDNIADGKLP